LRSLSSSLAISTLLEEGNKSNSFINPRIHTLVIEIVLVNGEIPVLYLEEITI
jgi:hypothetical protein